MKTVLVPIDFSDPSFNAACYALEVAKRLRSSIHLFHVIERSGKRSSAGQGIRSLMGDDERKKKASERIDFFKQKVEDMNRPLTVDFLKIPITYSIAEGRVHQEITKIAKEKKVLLIIMGMEGAGNINRFLFGSISRYLIDHSTYPILLIPGSAVYQFVKKIAFATDLGINDINLIESLAVFAKAFDAAILIAHISATSVDQKDQQKIDAFLCDVTCKNNYDKIYYRHIHNDNVADGILWLSVKGQIDVLAMVHRNQSLLNQLLGGSYTKYAARHIKIPLMVLKGNG